MRRPGKAAPEIHRITRARGPHSADHEARVVRYLVSMGIRTVCVVLVVVVDGPWRWVFAAGAIGLPYLAVVLANAGGERRGGRLPSPRTGEAEVTPSSHPGNGTP